MRLSTRNPRICEEIANYRNYAVLIGSDDIFTWRTILCSHGEFTYWRTRRKQYPRDNWTFVRLSRWFFFVFATCYPLTVSELCTSPVDNSVNLTDEDIRLIVRDLRRKTDDFLHDDETTMSSYPWTNEGESAALDESEKLTDSGLSHVYVDRHVRERHVNECNFTGILGGSKTLRRRLQSKSSDVYFQQYQGERRALEGASRMELSAGWIGVSLANKMSECSTTQTTELTERAIIDIWFKRCRRVSVFSMLCAHSHTLSQASHLILQIWFQIIVFVSNRWPLLCFAQKNTLKIFRPSSHSMRSVDVTDTLMERLELSVKYGRKELKRMSHSRWPMDQFGCRWHQRHYDDTKDVQSKAASPRLEGQRARLLFDLLHVMSCHRQLVSHTLLNNKKSCAYKHITSYNKKRTQTLVPRVRSICKTSHVSACLCAPGWSHDSADR